MFDIATRPAEAYNRGTLAEGMPSMRIAASGIMTLLCLAATVAAQDVQSPTPVDSSTRPAVPETIPDAWKQASPDGARWVAEGWYPPRPVELPDQFNRAFVIPLEGPITATTARVIEYKATKARSQQADLIVLDMNTPGGEGRAMYRIMEIIGDLDPATVIAWVNPEAFSAGAIISLACDEIVISPEPKASIGDAMPIIVTPQGGLQPLPDPERAKIESPIRADMRSMAERGGYSPDLCEAMVHMAMEIWLIRNEQTGQLKIIEAREWKKQQEARPTPEWVFLRTIDGPKQLVTLKSEAAIHYGLARAAVGDTDDLRTLYNIEGPITRIEDQPLDRVAFWLSHPAITGLLTMGLMAGAYMEFKTPGLGIFGAVAVLCLIALIGGRFLIGLANVVEVALLAIGIVLIVLEIFVIPGFGVAGITGIVLCVVSLLAMAIPNAIG
jgi:membrane-bound serine protease (ClpP class)